MYTRQGLDDVQSDVDATHLGDASLDTGDEPLTGLERVGQVEQGCLSLLDVVHQATSSVEHLLGAVVRGVVHNIRLNVDGR